MWIVTVPAVRKAAGLRVKTVVELPAATSTTSSLGRCCDEETSRACDHHRNCLQGDMSVGIVSLRPLVTVRRRPMQHIPRFADQRPFCRPCVPLACLPVPGFDPNACRGNKEPRPFPRGTPRSPVQRYAIARILLERIAERGHSFLYPRRRLGNARADQNDLHKDSD